MKDFYGLIILDGFGHSDCMRGNAIEREGYPYIRSLMKKYPNTLIGASGEDVGLPDGQMGNSEVGHLNMGAGRIVYQELTRITKSVRDGDFFTNDALLHAVRNARDNGKKLHLYGLLSDGGVHSHIEHLFALLELCRREKLNDVFVHCFMDGRDVSPTSGIEFVRRLRDKTEELGVGKIATISGRYYAMDRDNRWERLQKAYDALTLGEGVIAEDPVAAMQASYDSGVTDEFVVPTVIVENGKPVATIDRGDSVIFYNFRPDRAREITRAFTVKEFNSFERKTGYLDLTYVCFTRYDDTFENVEIAFKPVVLTNTFGEYLSKLGKTQLRIAETEKYAHVTFFFNGGVEAPNEGEDRVLIKSPAVATYDQKPEMSAYEVTDKAVELIKSGKYDVMILNFANCDMVGHTGVMEAAEKAVKAVDECVRRIVEAIQSVSGKAIITADHGNADKMLGDDGKPFTAHSTNPVPLIVLDDGVEKLREGGILADVVPTLLDIMNLKKPDEMTGRSLIEKKK